MKHGPPMVHKRPLLKSRTGCIQCKNRKVKCDESPNECGACVKRGTRCSLKPPTPPLPSPRPQTAVLAPGSSPLDLELLHNFSAKTCLSITTYAPLQDFYRTDFISEALKSDYLLHCLLGLSAFHLAQQRQEMLEKADEQQKLAIRAKINEYILAAHAHHNSGLSSFRQTLKNITSENCHALFACSALIAMTTFAQSCDSLRSINESMYHGSGPTVIKWLLLVRGIKSVLVEAQEWIQTGPMSPLLQTRGAKAYDNNIGMVEEEVTIYLNSLSAAVVQSSDPGASESCIAAIELLRKSFASMALGCDSSVVFFWPVQVPPEFTAMLELDRPEALTVFALFCVLLHTQNWRWLFRGWSSNMLGIVEGKLDEKWRRWLWLPLRVIRNEKAQRLKV